MEIGMVFFWVDSALYIMAVIFCGSRSAIVLLGRGTGGSVIFQKHKYEGCETGLLGFDDGY